MGAGTSHKGFTLIELMATVAIVAVAAAVTVPSVTQAIRDRRVQQQAITFMQGFREGEGRAVLRGRAHLLVVDLRNPSRPAQTLIEGTNTACRLSQFPVNNTVWTNDDLGTTSVSVEALAPAVTYVEFCYSPSGRMLYRYTAGSMFSDGNLDPAGNDVGGGFMYRVFDPNNLNLVVRRVFVSVSGSPRQAS